MFLAPCQNLDKTNDKIQRKHLDRWKEGRMDGRTNIFYFIGPLQLPPGFQKVRCENNSLTYTISLVVEVCYY